MNYLEKPDTSTSTQYSANITFRYDLNMTQKLVKSVGGQMCSTRFNFRPNPIIYPLTVFFSLQAVFKNNHKYTVDTISYISFRNSNKELWLGLHIFGIYFVDLKNQCFEVTKCQVTLHETRSAFSAY